MSAPSSGRKTPVDYGVQVRFIDEFGNSGGGRPAPQPKTKAPSKYGVAVRVQGIAGQPYVVLKDGQKGDSYGVQLRTHYPSGYNSLPRSRESDTQREDAGGGGGTRDQGGALRRAQSHGSLLDRDGEGGYEDFHLSRPPGDGKSGSYGNLDGGIGVRAERDQTQRVSGRDGGMERNMWGGSYQTGLNGSLHPGKKSHPHQDPPHQTYQVQSNQRQTNVSRQVNRFDGGHTVDQRRPPPAPSFPDHSTNQRPSPGRHPSAAAPQAGLSEAQVTPDLLLDQGQSAEMSGEEEQLTQNVYNILKQGTNENDVVIRHKVKLILQRFESTKPKDEWMREKRELERNIAELQTALRAGRGHSDATLKDELESCLDENLQLREMVDRKKTELNETQSELTQLRMERENAEARAREMEDHLAELQDELRRDDGSKTDLMSCQAQLMEVCQLKHKLEETLRQKERELTALKGALKDEVATHDKEIEALREQYSVDMEKLRSSMEQVSESHAGIEAERLRVNASVRTLQQQLEDCRDESGHWMEQFHTTRDELRTTKQDLLQTRLEKEESEEELKELKERVGSMKQQTVDHGQTQALNQELQRNTADLQKSRSDLEKQRTEFDKKVMEVIALKKSHQEQEAELKYEIDRLKGQLQRAREDYARAQEKNKKLPDPAAVSELEKKLDDARTEVTQLKENLVLTEIKLEESKMNLNKAQIELASLEESQQDQKDVNVRLKDKVSRLEVQLQTSASQSSEVELNLHSEVRSLRSELDEANRKVSRLNQEHRDLTARLQEVERAKEALQENVSHLEETKRRQERSLDKLNREFETLTKSSAEEAQTLKVQLEEQKEKARKEIQEVQRHGTDAQTELERRSVSVKRLEEEVARQKKEILVVCEERDNHQLDKELLANRLRHLEGELETSKNSYNEKAREIRILEDKLKRMELELEEEKNSVEMLSDRVSRSRDQIDQLRSELMQERSSKQDLELDKNTMERHLKELRSRVVDMEGQTRSSAGVSQLENKILELEERLRSEEREKNTVVASQRRLERKLKELNMTLDEERQSYNEQRDQLSLRVKALKRQVDEGETELERLDGLRRKAQRDMEEQMESKEALQSRINALEAELKRKAQAAQRSALDSSALSSDDDDSLYDASITSILTESNLQTSSC